MHWLEVGRLFPRKSNAAAVACGFHTLPGVLILVPMYQSYAWNKLHTQQHEDSLWLLKLYRMLVALILSGATPNSILYDNGFFCTLFIFITFGKTLFSPVISIYLSICLNILSMNYSLSHFLSHSSQVYINGLKSPFENDYFLFTPLPSHFILMSWKCKVISHHVLIFLLW